MIPTYFPGDREYHSAQISQAVGNDIQKKIPGGREISLTVGDVIFAGGRQYYPREIPRPDEKIFWKKTGYVIQRIFPGGRGYITPSYFPGGLGYHSEKFLRRSNISFREISQAIG